MEVPDSMFTLFRVMSGAQSDGESETLDSNLAFRDDAAIQVLLAAHVFTFVAGLVASVLVCLDLIVGPTCACSFIPVLARHLMLLLFHVLF